eukprot:1858659-Heterocapsa_arctica.AAC.1
MGYWQPPTNHRKWSKSDWQEDRGDHKNFNIGKKNQSWTACSCGKWEFDFKLLTCCQKCGKDLDTWPKPGAKAAPSKAKPIDITED